MKSILYWLLTGFTLVYAMVIIGGITRLTHSGLSIVEWNVIMGTLPPLNEQQWAVEFEKYRQSPEFKLINYNFTISDFKTIFWWEYIHRLLGRIIGVVFIVPFIWFLTRKKITKPLLKHLIIIFLLGAFQGLLGWLMVQSGLVDIPRVSHYRLAAHLLAATALMGYILWVALEIANPKSQIKNPKLKIQNSNADDKSQMSNLKNQSLLLLCFVVLQLIYGGFVAGMRAGFIYNTFPKMGDVWIATAVFDGWRQMGLLSLFENPATVQFIHRWLAFAVLFFAAYIFITSRKFPPLRKSSAVLLIAVLGQLSLGILTLLFSVPLWIAVAHQGVAMLLVSAVIFLIHGITEQIP